MWYNNHVSRIDRYVLCDMCYVFKNMKIRKLTDIKNLKNKRVLVRLDFNVPIKEGRVSDDYKILKSLPTIEYLLKQHAKIILVSHLGRPKGVVVPELRLDAPVGRLSELLKKPIKKLAVSTGLEVVKEIEKLKADGILFLENIQFEPGETKGDIKLAKELASYGDFFVNECFAQSHRDYASISKVAKYVSSYAGLLLAAEIEGLSKVTDKPKKPLVAIIGGIKMETKIPVIKQLLKKANYILVGGGILNTYLWAKGYGVGASLVDKDFKKEALAFGKNKKIIMPVDVVVGDKDGKNIEVLPISYKLQVTSGKAIYDIGPKTVQLFSKYIKQANTLVWNGALGYFEQLPYQHGTYAVARLFAARSRGQAFGVSGGGETVQILQKLGIIDDVDLVSTGGGAMLEYLGGKKLPGVKAVMK